MRKLVFLAIVLVATGVRAQDGTSFLRGDANLDLEVNLTDAVYILNNLFLGGAPLPCAEAADVNGDAATGGGTHVQQVVGTHLPTGAQVLDDLSW